MKLSFSIELKLSYYEYYKFQHYKNLEGFTVLQMKGKMKLWLLLTSGYWLLVLYTL